ncbi:MAG: hypothetical protein Q4F24_08165 [Eubacteriales bacterium]|nr:hypothetical protein [Eubacteriales bacterium]
MAIFTRWALTRAAKEMITKAQAGQTTISFTKARTGKGIWEPDEDLEYAEGIKLQMQEFEFSGIDIPDGNRAAMVLEVTMNNKGLSELYYVTEMGIFAKGSDGKEILYCILTSSRGTVYLPAENGIGLSAITERVNLEVADAANVTVETSGALVSATDFLYVRNFTEIIRKALSGGTEGQHIVKTGENEYQFAWETFVPVVTSSLDEFPETGKSNRLYIDVDSSELYVWLNGIYFKLPLGAEASSTLQRQITENRKAIDNLKLRTEKVEKVFSYAAFTVRASEWIPHEESGITVYQCEIPVKGMTEDTWTSVWPHTTAETAEGIVAEQSAQAVFFGKGKAYADDGKLILKCYKKVPIYDFGIKLQGVVV